MREPVFNETVQLGIVVRDLEATVLRYVDDYGIGPWQFAQIDLGEANNYREYGRPSAPTASPSPPRTSTRPSRRQSVRTKCSSAVSSAGLISPTSTPSATLG